MDDLKSFYAKPFRADMSALGWLLFLGMILCMVIFWNMILRHVFME